jgi:hypothetical protein
MIKLETMKTTKRGVTLGGALVLTIGLSFAVLAQTNTQTIQVGDFTVSLDDLQLVAPDSVPDSGNFWLLSDCLQYGQDAVPIPFDSLPQFPVYSWGADGLFLVDDTAPAQAPSVSSSRFAGVMDENLGQSDYSSPAYGSNDLWLEITGISNGMAAFNLHNATNMVYEVWSKTDLTAPAWNIEQEVWPTNQDTMPFSVLILDRTNSLFLWARDWTGIDENTNGIPDWWEWAYFGNLNQTASGDYDNDGVNNGMEYTNGTDPNKIQFSIVVTNPYVNSSAAPVQLNIAGGVPSSMAILLNTTNFSDAIWQPYNSSNIVASIGPNDGRYDVWIGLRGRLDTSQQTWQGTTFTLDTTAPTIIITNPTTTVVSSPLIQLQGCVSELLSSLTYDVSNAAGLTMNQEALITGAYPDTNTWTFATNYFQAYDVALTNGANTITFHATDLAGNVATTNLTVTLDYSSATNPPSVTILWPLQDTQIAGTNFVLQGVLDDDTASVTVTINSDSFVGIVERGGAFSVPNLPVLGSNDVFTIAATNAAGFGGISARTGYAVRTNQTIVNIDPVSPGSIYHNLATITGTVSDPTMDVWVNGVQATVNSDNSWQADNVLVRDNAGTGQFTVDVYSSSFDPRCAVLVGEQLFLVPLPPIVQASSYFRNYYWYNYSSCGPCRTSDTLGESWEIGVGGESWYYDYRDCTGQTDSGWSGWSGDYLPISPWECFSELDGSTVPGFASECGSYFTQSGTSDTRQTRIQLIAGGPAQKGVQQLIRLVVPVVDWNGIPVPPSSVQILGRSLIPTATNADVGDIYLSMPAGGTRDLPITVLSTNKFTFDAWPESVKMRILDAVTGQDLTDTNNTVVVGQKVSLVCQLSPTNATPTSIQWTIPGWAISNFVVSPDTSSGTVYSNFSTINSNVDFYWVDGAASRQVECSATVGGRSAVAKAIFNVSSPSPEFRADVLGIVAADTNYVESGIFSRPVLHFGGGEIPPVGIDLVYTNAATPPSGGKYFIAQVVLTSHIQKNQLTGTNIVGLERVRYGLDGLYPYQGTSSPAAHDDWPDSPGSVLDGTTWLARTDSFSAFLMFRPSPYNDSTIAVPLSGANWGWSGIAKTNYSSTGYVLISGAPTTPIASVATTFPQWTTNAASIVDFQTNSIPFNEN